MIALMTIAPLPGDRPKQAGRVLDEAFGSASQKEPFHPLERTGWADKEIGWNLRGKTANHIKCRRAFSM